MDGSAVLVGFDASPAAERALRWAAAEASLREVPLVVCHAWTWPYPLTPQDEEALEIVRGMGTLALDDGVRLARHIAPGLDVRPLWTGTTPPSSAVRCMRGAGIGRRVASSGSTPESWRDGRCGCSVAVRWTTLRGKA